jgi:hypothetical protein
MSIGPTTRWFARHQRDEAEPNEPRLTPRNIKCFTTSRRVYFKRLIRGRLLDVVDGSPLIRRRSFNMVNHDDFDGPLAGFQFQVKLLLEGAEQRGGIGIGWG